MALEPIFHCPDGIPSGLVRTSVRISLFKLRSTLLSVVPFAYRVPVPLLLSEPTTQMTLPLSVASLTIAPPVIADNDWVAIAIAWASLVDAVREGGTAVCENRGKATNRKRGKQNSEASHWPTSLLYKSPLRDFLNFY